MRTTVHFGQVGMATPCGASPLMVHKASANADEIDCRGCLWAVMAQSLANVNRIAHRLKQLTDVVSVEVKPLNGGGHVGE